MYKLFRHLTQFKDISIRGAIQGFQAQNIQYTYILVHMEY